MTTRSTLVQADVALPCIRIQISPKSPSEPLFSRNELATRVRDLTGRGMIPNMRRIQNGFTTLLEKDDPFEINLHGLMSYAQTLNLLSRKKIVYAIGRLMRIALFMFQDTSIEMPIQVELEGIKDCSLQDNVLFLGDMETTRQSLDDIAIAQIDVLPGTWQTKFIDHVVELVIQLMWAFDWGNEQEINDFVREIMHSQWPELSARS
jgi:hypothetical protein